MHTVEKTWLTKAGLQAAVLFVNDSHRCGYVAVTDENPLWWFGFDCAHLGDAEQECERLAEQLC